jgi:hypothetical protein
VSVDHVWVVVRSVIHITNVSNRTFSNYRVMLARREISFISPSPIYYKFNFLPPGKIRYALYKRLGGFQGQSGQVRKISPPPIFDPWTVHSVASHYTN